MKLTLQKGAAISTILTFVILVYGLIEDKVKLFPNIFDWILLNIPFGAYLRLSILMLSLLLFLIWWISCNNSKLKKNIHPKPLKAKCFTVDKFKWKVFVHNKNSFEINGLPFCIKHDLRMMKGVFYYGCPEYPHNCTSFIPTKKYYEVYNKALSYIEKQIKFPK